VAELAEFQRAAVSRIVERLLDPKGSGRFLLADEVGLGKTLVARGVIDGMRRRRKSGDFIVVYICSNSEIGAQNRDKLSDVPANTAGRLTLLSLESADIGRLREKGLVQVFSFTPGTSLQIGQATGVKQERRLLMYLIMRVWGRRVNRQKWRDFFRCGAHRDKWDVESKFGRIRRDFSHSVAKELQNRLRQEWASSCVKLFDSGGKERTARPLRDCLDEGVESFRDGDKISHKNRNLVIGRLRHCLARVALDFLEPNLIILDEFQRFSDILDDAAKQESIVGKLFGASLARILILSATPYKMYTLRHEDEDHHADFMRTYAFLRKVGHGKEIERLRDMLGRFRARLEDGKWIESTDPELQDLKHRIEGELKLVMCRTERNWYLDRADKGVLEIWDRLGDAALPKRTELLEYVRLREFLLRKKIADWNITDFWKSSPSLLSFMDGHYGLMRRLRSQRSIVPAAILQKPEDLKEVGANNLKFRLLLNKVFVSPSTRLSDGRREPWKYLWIRPTYTYYKDTFYGGNGPQKYLVFSHWKFVPKAVSIIVSQEVEHRLGKQRIRLRSAPLQFRDKTSFYPFDLCYPSPLLADSISQLVVAEKTAGRSSADLYQRAENRMKQLLSTAGIEISKSQSVPLWRLVARMEALSPFAEHVRKGFGSKHEVSEHYPAYVAKYLQWMDDTETHLAISPRWLRRLTLIALYSPAICTLRALASEFPYWANEWAVILNFCLNALRTYFNKPLVQTVIRNHGAARGSYAERVIRYSEKAHYQAMIDEYTYLLRNVLQRRELPELLGHVGRVFGMWTGQPLVNRRTRTGRIAKIGVKKAAHFALAFGEDVSTESSEVDGKTRRTAVRESFNSPFWPFVLATTSVGQEGLDLHLYCRDIVHWNLPSNPVDLEQREGRINRYDGLCIRQNIARDVPLSALAIPAHESVWNSVFKSLREDLQTADSPKHGLYPHWIYQPILRLAEHAEGDELIRRHLLFYTGSGDAARYQQLKVALSIYRLVFGQPRQQDIVERLVSRFPSADAAAMRDFQNYTINLSPVVGISVVTDGGERALSPDSVEG